MTSFFLIIAIAFAGSVGAILLWQDWQFWRSGTTRVVGTVTGHHVSHDDGSVYHMCRLAFVDEAGQRREFGDDFGRATPKPPAGSRLPVVYPKGRPERARVSRPALRLFLYAFIFGMLAILVGKLIGY